MLCPPPSHERSGAKLDTNIHPRRMIERDLLFEVLAEMPPNMISLAAGADHFLHILFVWYIGSEL